MTRVVFQVVIKYVPYVGDSKRAMDEYTSEIMMGGTNTIALHNTCEVRNHLISYLKGAIRKFANQVLPAHPISYFVPREEKVSDCSMKGANALVQVPPGCLSSSTFL